MDSNPFARSTPINTSSRGDRSQEKGKVRKEVRKVPPKFPNDHRGLDE